MFGKLESKGSVHLFSQCVWGGVRGGAPSAGPLSSGCEALTPPPLRPSADPSGAGSGTGRPRAGSESSGSGRWGRTGLSCFGLLFLLVGSEVVRRGEDDSKAQPDVAGRRRGWQRLGGGPAGREGGGAGHPRASPGEGGEPPGPAVRGQQRAALGLWVK